MSGSLERIPQHLRKYVVEQDYARYTSEEQATWRFILRQLKDFLKNAAHPCYLEGLEKTGISIDRIPQISEMDQLLQKFGWGAVPVSGFIPPAAFMEFQSLGVLPIACDMRSLDHLLYTPAPDIVHEAAGHAPILIHPEYAQYLKSYAQVAKKAIISKEDLDQYEAIRKLSDLKEHSSSTRDQIKSAEDRLNLINKNISHISEASLLSRMNWWTAEYGLVGSLSDPKIYGAGLLSSLGESRECLKPHVKKIPLDVTCVDTSYDITEPQPQLYVTPDFAHLIKVLEDLAQKLSYRRGGVYGLEQAKKAKSVNTVQLNSGLQISGILDNFDLDQNEKISFIKFSGPTQISLRDQQLTGHHKEYHSHGYSSPLGSISGLDKSLHLFSQDELRRLGLEKGKDVELNFSSGIKLHGTLTEIFFDQKHPMIFTFKKCTVKLGEKILFDPSWGDFDLAAGSEVTSVFGGPADRISYGDMDDFVAEKIPAKQFADHEQSRFRLYHEISALRSLGKVQLSDVRRLWERYQNSENQTWLMGVEILEMTNKLKSQGLTDQISDYLLKNFSNDHENIKDGLRLSKDL